MLQFADPKKLDNKEITKEDVRISLRKGSHGRWIERGNWVGEGIGGNSSQVWGEAGQKRVGSGKGSQWGASLVTDWRSGMWDYTGSLWG